MNVKMVFENYVYCLLKDCGAGISLERESQQSAGAHWHVQQPTNVEGAATAPSFQLEFPLHSQARLPPARRMPLLCIMFSLE
jgi:hypothetical protein